MTILNVPPLAQAEAVGTDLLTRLNTPTLAQARAKTWVEIINAELAHYPRGDYKDAYGPNIDSHYATKSMRQSIEDGLPSDVPLLAGNNSGDMPGLITGMIQQMPWRSTHNRAAQYVYKFSKVPVGWAARGVLSYHGGELVYVFNNPTSLVSHHLLGLVLDPATGLSLVIGDLNGNGVTGSAGDAADVLASAAYGADDAAVAQTAMTMWTNFAKTGNPSTATFTWPPYTTANDTFVEINTGLTVRTGLATGW
ncbi:MAG: carboxylesterase family protein [Cytophagales bacterium]|nr:carboxylesterase family protein [Rhizobacter sp.]